MLFKLAWQNIKRSKGYFIAYILTVAVFFTIVYQLANIEQQLGHFFVDGVKLSDLKISETFMYLKYFLYVIILFFSAYVSRFFVKRRSKEIALLKTLGLNRRNIWYIFLIENAIIVSIGFVVGIISGVLFSRIVAIGSMEMIGLKISNVGFTFSGAGIVSVLIIMVLVYFIISMIPLRTINKSSIIELMSGQVSGEVQTKKPWISLILFVIFTTTLCIQIFVIIPDPKADITTTKMLLYFGNAVVVAILLYRGLLSYFFVNFRLKNKGIKSPVRMLSFNHLASNLSGVQKMMSFITVFSAIVTIAVIISFGFMNKMTNGFTSGEEKIDPIRFVSKPGKQSENLHKSLLKIDKKTEKMPLYTYKNALITNNEEDPFTKRNVLVLKYSDYVKFSELSQIKPKAIKKGQVITNYENNDVCKDKIDEYSCQMLKYTKTKQSDLVYDDHLFYLTLITSEDKLKPTNDLNSKQQLNNNLSAASIYVLEDDNIVFQKLKHIDLYNMSIAPDKSNVFDFFDLLIGDQLQNQENVVLLNDFTLMTVTSIIVMGLFQLVFLLASMVSIIALMMAIFFRTLENLEKSIQEYVIAKRLGLSNKKVMAALFIESFTTQVLPFLLGAGVSLLMFDKLVVPRLGGMYKLKDILFEGYTMLIYIVIFVMLMALLLILLYTITKKISEAKQIKIV